MFMSLRRLFFKGEAWAHIVQKRILSSGSQFVPRVQRSAGRLNQSLLNWALLPRLALSMLCIFSRCQPNKDNLSHDYLIGRGIWEYVDCACELKGVRHIRWDVNLGWGRVKIIVTSWDGLRGTRDEAADRRRLIEFWSRRRRRARPEGFTISQLSLHHNPHIRHCPHYMITHPILASFYCLVHIKSALLIVKLSNNIFSSG